MIDRDGKFIQEFQTTFNSSFWELYINALLRSRGFTPDFDNPSPDFYVTRPWQFTLEAAIASNAQDDPPEYEQPAIMPPVDLDEFNRAAIIRVANAIHSKYQRYRSHYSKLPHVQGKPFVIAVAAFDCPHFFLAAHRAIDAVLFRYYVEEKQYLETKRRGEPIPKTIWERVNKDNGSPIDLGCFVDGSMPEVSAVICNPCATWGKVRALDSDPNPRMVFTALRLNTKSTFPHKIVATTTEYKETLLDGLRVYHNPDARFPLDPAVFRSDEVFQAYFSRADDEWVYEQKDGQLLFRNVMTIEVSDT